jgi:hypothetical protein
MSKLHWHSILTLPIPMISYLTHSCEHNSLSLPYQGNSYKTYCITILWLLTQVICDSSSSSAAAAKQPFWAKAFPRRFCQICLFCQELFVFLFLDFTTVVFLTEQGHHLCIQPLTWRTRSLYLCSPVTGWPSYTPMHWDHFSSPAFCRATLKVF